MTVLDALSKVLPIILLLLLGLYLRKIQFLRVEAIQDIKKLVINLTLPALLFLAFARVSLEPRHLIIVVLVFGTCLAALLIGKLIQPVTRIPSPYFPMLLTGFEAGMMGYAIYGAVYGADNIFKFAIIDLGQVTFVFFVLVSILDRLARGAKRFSETLLAFVKTPVIVAILLGIVVNQTGMFALINASSVTASLVRALELLGALTTPLIVLLIGYEVRLAPRQLIQPAQVVAFRLLFWVPVGLILNALILKPLLNLDLGFQAAVLTMFVLPPPFIIPLFVDESDQANRTFVGNTLSLATLVTLVAFALITVFYLPT